MHDVEIPFEEGHGLQDYHADIDGLAHAYISEGCAGVSIGATTVRIHLEDEIAADDPLVGEAVGAIEQFYQELRGQ